MPRGLHAGFPGRGRGIRRGHEFVRDAQSCGTAGVDPGPYLRRSKAGAGISQGLRFYAISEHAWRDRRPSLLGSRTGFVSKPCLRYRQVAPACRNRYVNRRFHPFIHGLLIRPPAFAADSRIPDCTKAGLHGGSRNMPRQICSSSGSPRPPRPSQAPASSRLPPDPRVVHRRAVPEVPQRGRSVQSMAS